MASIITALIISTSIVLGIVAVCMLARHFDRNVSLMAELKAAGELLSHVRFSPATGMRNLTALAAGLRRMITRSGRACLALERATVFAVGRVGSDGHVSRGEQALRLILKEPEATSLLLRVFRQAAIPGKLYALLGLSECGYCGIGCLMNRWRNSGGEVSTQIASLRVSESVRTIIRRIEDGTYSRLLNQYELG